MNLVDALAGFAWTTAYLRDNPHETVVRFRELEDHLALVRYYLMPKDGWRGSERESVAHVACSAPGCVLTSLSPDACVLNFAAEGAPPLWLCRDHHPKLEGGITRPGFTPPAIEHAQRESDRKAALAKLSPAERQLINGNIVR